MNKAERSVVDCMLNPRSIAVVGASEREGSLGYTIMKKILGFGFTGEVHPINPKSAEIMGKKAYRLTSLVPGEVDTAVLCVPGQFVNDVVKDLGKKGTRSCIIISAGFKEIGPEGVEREKELSRIAAEYGIRIIGPNCFGIINGIPGISLDCTFARNFTSRGNIGFVSQSGALGAGVNEDLRLTTMGLSYFISLGNRLDFNENEAIEYLARDENTKIIIMYLENFADPEKFLETAEKITRTKPILALKAGRGERAAAAVASHTGQLAQSDRMVDALMYKAGIIRVYSVREMLMAAKALYSGVIPEKEDLAVITNAGGFGVLSIDRAEELNMKLARFHEKTTAYLESHLPIEASCNNPIDLLGTGTDEHYGIALEGVMKDPGVGGVIYNFGPPVMQSAEPLARKAVEHSRKNRKIPIFSIFMNRNRIMDAFREAPDVYMPQFDYPEDGVFAFKKLLEYKKIRERMNHDRPDFCFDVKKAESIINRAAGEGRKGLDFDEGEEILRAYRIPTAGSVVIRPGENPEEKLKGMNAPYAIKPLWGGIVHKTEMKAVRINLKNAPQVAQAIGEISRAIESRTGEEYTKGFIVQEMAKGSTEIIMGCSRQSGGIPMLMFGLGGIFVELLKDVSFAIPPVNGDQAQEMMESIKGYPMLKGFRGQEGVDIDEIRDTIVKLSCLVSDFPRIKELDINPFIASSRKGESLAVDVRILL